LYCNQLGRACHFWRQAMVSGIGHRRGEMGLSLRIPAERVI
jgi:hypothetical protein